MQEKKSYLFLCDQSTESECLQKLLVGTTQTNSLWAVTVTAGDEIYLFNYQTGVIRGPYAASSGADCHDPTAWGGKFPVQIRISRTPETRQSDNHRKDAPSFLRKRRPHHDLASNASELFSWIQQHGTPVE